MNEYADAIAMNALNHCRRFIEEHAAYERLKGRARGEPTDEERKAIMSRGGYAFVAAQGILACVKAYTDTLRSGLADTPRMQAVVNEHCFKWGEPPADITTEYKAARAFASKWRDILAGVSA